MTAGIELEITHDTAAVLTFQGQRFALSGTFARDVIAGYRHTLVCPVGGGQDAAAHYLHGVVHGLRYSIFDQQIRIMDDVEKRRGRDAEST